MLLVTLIFWLAFSVIVGVFASQRRNRSGFGWFVLALFISPVLAFLLCAAMQANAKSNGYDWRLPAHGQEAVTLQQETQPQDSREVSEMPLVLLFGACVPFVVIGIAIVCFVVLGG
jgi:hypothetical protein